MWVVIVAGHLFTSITGQSYWPSQADCMNMASAVGGRCVQQAAPADNGQVCVLAMPGQYACYKQ